MRRHARKLAKGGMLAGVVLTLFTAQAQAVVNLVTDFPTGLPLVMDAGTVSSPMTVSIDSDAQDLIQGWQTTLWILPLPGSTGTVGFNSTAEPLGYVFGNRRVYMEDLSFPLTNDGMLAFDANFAGALLPPVAVPGPPGLNLNALDFEASIDASGLFGVFAVGGQARSEWTDDNMMVNLFDNIDPLFDSHTQIGEIQVNPAGQVIPEPVTALLGVLSLGLLGATLARRR